MTNPLDAFARRWWSGELGAAGAVLDVMTAPAEAAYRGLTAARNRAYRAGLLRTTRVGAPVVSIGNVAVGGTGKTPFAHWVARLLRERGARPALLHGGYAADEPALHRRWSPDIPVVVERDRVAGARRALADGANVLVLDDAFQHRRLHRDLDIVLVAAERWRERVRLLPRGPWRESGAALRRAHVVVITHRTASTQEAERVGAAVARITSRPVAVVHLAADAWLRDGTPAAAPTAPAVLIAGLAEPAIFEDSVRAAGGDVARLLPFADHHDYTAEDARAILDAAGTAPIVTTEKDWVKLDRLLPAGRVWVLAQRVLPGAGTDVLIERLDAIARRARDGEGKA